MAGKAKKDKPKKVAIGDQMLLECARWRERDGIACSLRDYMPENEMRIKSLITVGYIEKTEGGKYLITDEGIAYIMRNFPDFSAVGGQQYAR